jgi:hypothetical protein
VGHENSGVGDPSDESERFQPRHPAPNPGHPPTQETPVPPLKQGGRAGEQQGARTGHSAKQGAAYLQGARSQGARSQIRVGRVRRSNSILHVRAW